MKRGRRRGIGKGAMGEKDEDEGLNIIRAINSKKKKIAQHMKVEDFGFCNEDEDGNE
jgi:hypothetical protein